MNRIWTKNMMIGTNFVKVKKKNYFPIESNALLSLAVTIDCSIIQLKLF